MMRLPASYREPKIFNNKYIIKNQLSSGSFGVVYLAFDKHTREEVAVKLEKEENEDVCTLDREISILQKLANVPGVPKLFWSGFEQDYNVIVIQLLGKDLSHFIKQHKKLSLKSVLQISTQLLRVLQSVHERGVIHRDFKPENILTGLKEDSGTIFLVDFGVSKMYLDSQHRHIPFKDKKSFIGTTRYASIAAHKGYELGRKDDIESMFYVLIYFLKGKLPWQNLQNIGDRDRTELVGEVKQQTDVGELCKDCPIEFQEIMMYLKTLEFRSEPDYKMIQLLLIRSAQANNIVLDKQFEWTEKTRESIQLKEQQPLKESQQMINKESKIRDQVIWAVSGEERKSLTPTNLLKVPDPQLRNSANSPIRGDTKHLTNTSVQGSFSSMMIKYIPSQIDNLSIKKDKQSRKSKSRKSKKSKSSKKSTKNKKPPSASYMDVNLNSNHAIQVSQPEIRRHRTLESTWGFHNTMEEYSSGSPKLNDKFKQLPTLQVKFDNKKKK